MSATTAAISPYVIACASRRAAGVWTQTPSLTFALLRAVSGPASVVWVDFGRRYEMFNHLRVNAQQFPRTRSLSGLVDLVAQGTALRIGDLMTYSELVCGTASAPPLSDISIEPDGYRAVVAALEAERKTVYLMPAEADLSEPKLGKTIAQVELVTRTLDEVYRLVSPSFVFLTWEGQPELLLFEKILTEDPLLRWGLTTSDLILCHVRFDSRERFADSVPIANLLVLDKAFGKRVRIILTRASQEPSAGLGGSYLVIGTVPFDAFVSRSVQSGRIPLLDVWQNEQKGNDGGGRTFAVSMTTTADMLTGHGVQTLLKTREVAINRSADSTKCDFCQLPADRIVHESRFFRFIIPRTQITSGHILLVSRTHALSIQSLPAEAITEAREIVREYLQTRPRDGNTVVVWEHGNHGIGAPNELWHSHAHLHIVPGVPGIRDALGALGWITESRSYELPAQSDREYFYYEDALSDPVFLFPVPPIPPQLLRKMLKSAMGQRGSAGVEKTVP